MDDAGIQPKNKDSTILGALPYVLGTLVAVLVFLLAKDDKFARYHALQALLFQFALIPIWLVVMFVYVISMITFIGPFILFPFIMLGALCVMAFNVYLAYKAFQGESLMLPKLGELVVERI